MFLTHVAETVKVAGSDALEHLPVASIITLDLQIPVEVVAKHSIVTRASDQEVRQATLKRRVCRRRWRNLCGVVGKRDRGRRTLLSITSAIEA